MSLELFYSSYVANWVKLKDWFKSGLKAGKSILIVLPAAGFLYILLERNSVIAKEVSSSTLYILIGTFYISIFIRYIRLNIILAGLKKQKASSFVNAVKTVIALSLIWTAALTFFSVFLFFKEGNIYICILFEISTIFAFFFTYPKREDIEDWLLLAEFPYFLR